MDAFDLRQHQTHHFSVFDLSAVFCRPTLYRTFISTVPRGKDTSGDVVFEKLLVYYVDYSRNDCFDVLLSRYQSLYVICSMSMLEAAWSCTAVITDQSRTPGTSATTEL
jgi:hypothetical protein